MNEVQPPSGSPNTLDYLLSPLAVRERAVRIFDRALAGATHFEICEAELAGTSRFVLEVIRENYPSLVVPYHSRWRHFEVGKARELERYRRAGAELDALERARRGLDLILPSVLVDAGAGADWRYTSSAGETVGRSEGLALASLDMFMAAGFSHRGAVESTARGLQAVDAERFRRAFRVSDDNPLLGVEGRVALLNNLGAVIASRADVFASGRPGDLVDYLLASRGRTFKAVDVLDLVLRTLGGIWPGRLHLDGVNLGDTWLYRPFGETSDAYVPFHKLSQWLSYSIIETLEQGGFTVTDLNQLTGLAEYRNGGLMLDSGLLRLRDPGDAQQAWSPASEIVIEWRALTVCLLDKIAARLAKSLDKTADEFPLAKVLEGGTWAAGRRLAQMRRGNLTPPLAIDSDATVF